MNRRLSLALAWALLPAACGGIAGTVGAGDAGPDGSSPDAAAQLDAAADGRAPLDAAPLDAADAGSDAPRDAAIDNDPRCPKVYGATGECATDGLTCQYAQGRCDCQRPCSGVFIPDASWACSPWVPGCPDDPPVNGSPCANPGAHCLYPGCCADDDFTCQGGIWDAAPPFCPP